MEPGKSHNNKIEVEELDAFKLLKEIIWLAVVISKVGVLLNMAYGQ